MSKKKKGNPKKKQNGNSVNEKRKGKNIELQYYGV
jgi:hypothetical protein